MKRGVLIISIVYPPNMGGVETHLGDLTKALSKYYWKSWVLAYKPITTKIKAPFKEKNSKITIYRLPWLSGLFYKLVNKPFIEFLYLFPGLFLAAPLILLFNGKEIKAIHGQGLIGGSVSVVWGRILGKKVVVSTHNTYHFPPKSLYTKFAKWIFASSDQILTLSRQSKREIEKLGIKKEKIKVFTYWLDLGKFKKITQAKEKLGWSKRFIVLFVGRLVPEKGLQELLQAAKTWDKNITLVIAGTGPLESRIKNQELRIKNLIFLGRVDNEKLPLYYSAADLLIVPSIHEEGFGRVILESLACGTPVIGANRGAIPEAIDETVGKLIEISPENIKTMIEYFYRHPKELEKLAENARSFAEKRYNESNVETIIKAYNEN